MSLVGLGKDRSEDQLAVLLEIAARHTRPSGLTELLSFIGESLDAAACLLWRAAPYYERGNRQGRRLHVLAHWLQDGSQYATHDIPFESLTGEAINSGCPISARLVDHSEPNATFIEEHLLRWICVTPLRFADGAEGALNVYRREDIPFSEEGAAAADRFARVLAPLYQSMQEKAALALISEVRNLIESAERAERPPEVIQELCAILHRGFSCVESSIFLENRLRRSGEFRLVGRSGPSYLAEDSYTARDGGLTEWALQHARPVKIFDLAHFQRDLVSIQGEYPGLEWLDSLDIKSTTRALLELSEESPLPPLSFMAVPVLEGNTVLGVIRCCTVTQAPFYFSENDISLLRVFASEASHFWSSWLDRQEMRDEISAWRTFAAGIQELNALALTELDRKEPNRQRIFREGLSIASQVIRGADILDVRLYDAAKNELYFDTVHGQAWFEGQPSEVKQRLERRFVVAEEPYRSAGAWVVRNNVPRVIPDVTSDPYYSATFTNAQRMIIAPISAMDQRYGVLDVRSAHRLDLSPQSELMTILLGQQLGLYQYLATVVDSFRQTQLQLDKTLRVQEQSYEDLEHQLRSPIRQALQRISALMSEEGQEDRPAIRAVRGLIGKAHNVVRSVRVFQLLHKGDELPIVPARLSEESVTKAVIETGVDNQLLLGSDTGVNFRVDRDSFSVLRDAEVYADLDLLEQSLHNIVENAFKYSTPHTTIRVSATLRDHFFWISVVNRGIAFPAADRENAIRRGWRGELAKSVTASGSGIGLWLAYNIMKAHRGELEILSTTAEGATEIRLVLPASRKTKR